VSRQRDLTAALDAALAALLEAGFGVEAEQIRAAAAIPTTSALEITGAIGVAILRVQSSVGHLLPPAAKRSLQECLREIRRSWPGLELEPGG